MNVIVDTILALKEHALDDIMWMALVFAVLSVILIGLILLRKFSLYQDKLLKKKYWGRIQENLAMILVQSDSTWEAMDEYQDRLDTLKMLSARSSKITQWLLDEVIRQTTNITGNSNEHLLKLYNDLNLKQFSLKKLSSRKWHVIARGIQELDRMQQNDCIPYLVKFLHSANPDLRKTARLGLTSLAPRSLTYLDHMNEELSEWEQMAIHNRLRIRKKDELPDFSRYYYHRQPSVVSFCVRMTVEFNYFERVPQLIDLLERVTSQTMQVTVIEALYKLEAYQAVATITKLIQKSDHTEVIVRCLKFLGSIGDESSGELIRFFLNHSQMDVRMEAVNAAIHLGLTFEHADQELHQMILHHKNELIL